MKTWTYSGGSVFAGVSNYFPLYFVVKQLNEVMATEQPCDLAYEFGDGLFDLYDYPQGFPKPGVESCLLANIIWLILDIIVVTCFLKCPNNE